MRHSFLQLVIIHINNYTHRIQVSIFLLISLSLLIFGLIISKHFCPKPDVGSETIILHSHDNYV